MTRPLRSHLLGSVHGPQVRPLHIVLKTANSYDSGGTGWCKDATLAALKAGYRHLDCAWMYGVSLHTPSQPHFRAMGLGIVLYSTDIDH
jgi:hypothetical protein